MKFFINKAFVVLFCLVVSLPTLGVNYDEKFKDFFDQFENSSLLSSPLQVALQKHGTKGGVALDIGAGTGRDTLHLLKNKFKVVALDPAPRAVADLKKRFAKKFGPQFEAVESTLENYEPSKNLDMANMIWTTRFLNPNQFSQSFNKVTGSLKVGGRFVVDFCGERWGHRDKKRQGLFFTYSQVITLFSENYQIEHFNEKLKTHQGGFTEHLYEVVARKVR